MATANVFKIIKENKMTKCKKELIGFALVASIVFGGCDTISGGSYCDDKEGQNLFTKLLKEYLLKNQKDLQEHIDKVSFSYEIDKEHSIINEDEQSAACFIKNITIKFDKGDSIVVDGAFSDGEKTPTNFFDLLAGLAGTYQLLNELPSRFMYGMAYKEDKKTKQTRIEVMAPLFSGDVLFYKFFKDIPKNIIDYYDGTGVLINGKRKGACPDGIRQTRDKNGEIAFEGGCTNGTKDGAWKYYENGFLAKEELYKNGLLDKMTEYYPVIGKIKATFKRDDSDNGKYIKYKENGFIEGIELLSISKNTKGDRVVNEKIFGKLESRKFGLEKIEADCGILQCGGDYAEIYNDKIVLKREYLTKSIIGKTEQEIFEEIDKTPPEYEVVVLGNLALRIVCAQQHYGLLSIKVYKNDEKIGYIKSLDSYYKTGYESSGYCTTGQCQVMYKELIDKSFHKDKIYSALESAKPAKE